MTAYHANMALHIVETSAKAHRRLHHERHRLRDALGMACILIVFPTAALWALAWVLS